MKKIRYLLITSLFMTVNAYADAAIHFVIVGLKEEPLKNVSARLETLRNTYPAHLNTSNINQIYKQGAVEIQKALQPYGYYQSHLTTRLRQKGDSWTATYNVTKGPALYITTLDIAVTGDGVNNRNINKILKHLPLKKGDVLQTATYENTKDNLFDACNNAGYIKAHFTKTEIEIDLKKYQSYITIHLDTGKRYYFGDTDFSSSPFSPDFLKRFISYKKGKPFSNKKLIDLQQDMSSSYYFNHVDITPDFMNSMNNEIPVHINTSVPRSQRYNIGLGYGTFTGPRMTAGVSFRRITNTGQHVDMNIRLSQVLSSISLKYFIPGKNPITDRWLIGANYKKFAPKNGNSESSSFLFGYLNKIKNFQTSTTFNYLRERYTVLNEPNRSSKLLYPNFTVSYIKANDLINPTHGYSWNVSLQGAYEKIFSTTSFLQGDAKAKYITSPFSFAKIIARGELGYTLVHNLYDLPLTMRFFAGGLTSIRGFPDSSIGPGKYLQIGSLEYQNKLYRNLSGAAFYDIGVASDHFGTPINRGIGVGLVYNSMVGPIKVYVAKAISKKDQPYGVEFSIGPEF